MSEQKELVNSREAILDAAVQLFSEHGYSGTTMRAIAKAVGLLPGSLYTHIDSKETLLFEVVEDGIEKFLTIQRQVEDSTDPADKRLRTAIKAHIALAALDRERMLIVFHQWRFLSEPNRSRAIEMRRQYAQAYVNIIKDGMESGVFRRDIDPQIAVFSILGALNWTPEWYRPDGPISAEEVGERMADTLISGLQPK